MSNLHQINLNFSSTFFPFSASGGHRKHFCPFLLIFDISMLSMGSRISDRFTDCFRRFLFSVTVLIVTFSSICPLSRAQDADSLNVMLESFSTGYSLEKANSILSSIASLTESDEIETFRKGADESQVQTNVWYYAADYMYGMQQYGKSVDYAKKALEACRRISDKDFEADVLSLLAISTMRQGNYERAAFYAEQCYDLDRKSKDPDRISSSLNTLAGIYLTSKRYPEAEKYVLKGIEECSKTTNKPRMAILMGMASEVYQSIGKSDIALDYVEKALILHPADVSLQYMKTDLTKE